MLRVVPGPERTPRCLRDSSDLLRLCGNKSLACLTPHAVELRLSLGVRVGASGLGFRVFGVRVETVE